MSGGDRMTLAQALDRLPKVELHCHIEGTMRATTVVELARRQGRTLPSADPTALYAYDSLDGFLSIFWLVQACLETRDDWARLAYESVVDGAAHGVVYRESFFTPARHLASGQRLDDIVAGLGEGLAAAEAETGTAVRLICDMDRAFGGTAGRELVELLIDLRARGGADRVIGVGMDSTERGVDPADYAEAFALAGRAGFHRTAHLGEDGPAASIRYGVESLGIERIDHGVAILDDPAVVELVRDRAIPLTVCPISNVLIANIVPRLEDHPWPRLVAAGLRVTINSDDPALIQSDLGQEYVQLARAFGYGFDEMAAFSAAGVEATWLSPAERASLAARMASEAAELRRSLAELQPAVG